MSGRIGSERQRERTREPKQKRGCIETLKISPVGKRETNCGQPAAALHHALSGGPLGRATEYRENEDRLGGCAECHTLLISELTYWTTAGRGASWR